MVGLMEIVVEIEFAYIARRFDHGGLCLKLGVAVRIIAFSGIHTMLCYYVPVCLRETSGLTSAECSYHKRSADMATLTPEQRQEIQRAGEEPVRLADPETQTEYVILKADVYDRIRALADDTRAAYPLAMKVFGQDGWDDPQMDEYNVLDPRR
jgi:hypothetical protein